MAEAVSTSAEISGLPPIAPAPTTVSESAVATDVFHGWAAFQRAVNVTLAGELAKAETINADTLRILATGG